MAVSPNVLAPPNHQMMAISIQMSVIDLADAAPVCRIRDVTSNEPAQGLGDGDTAPDWVITGALGLTVRAERSGSGNGRVYTVALRCTDRSGNSAEKAATVSVPH